MTGRNSAKLPIKCEGHFMKICFLLAILIIFIIIAGCMTITINSKVNTDASISDYKVTVETTSMVYNLIAGKIKSSFDESLFNIDEKWTGDKVTITIQAKGKLQSLDPTKLHIENTGKTMRYEDMRLLNAESAIPTNQYSETMANSFTVHYYLEMPGNIIDSNANKIQGNKAEWHLTGNEAFTKEIWAESELPLFQIPGFGVLVTILGMLIVMLFTPKLKN